MADGNMVQLDAAVDGDVAVDEAVDQRDRSRRATPYPRVDCTRSALTIGEERRMPSRNA